MPGTTPPPPVTSLRVTHTSTVTDDQIDHLGHMNVRYYAVNAEAATQRVLDDLEGWPGGAHVVHDVYTRHHREQMLGTPLEVRSAVLGATDAGVRVHDELASADAGVLAATFVHVVSPVDERGARVPVAARWSPPRWPRQSNPLPMPRRGPSRSTVTSWPPRPISAWSGRAILRCAGNGRSTKASATTLAAIGPRWRPCSLGAAIRSRATPGGHLHETADGRLMGWALMETRAQFGTLPRAGDRIQAFGAGVAIYDKVTHRVQWCFDIATGTLISVFETVDMAFDIRARRPMSIPDGYRRREQERLQPDLAPGGTP